MALKRLTNEEMVQVSGEWVVAGSPARKAMLAKEELSGLVPRVEAAHTGLLALQPTAPTARAASLMAEAAALDQTHDTLIRGVHGLLGGLILLADTPEQAEAYAHLRTVLLPEGLDHIQKTYRGEAGAAEMLASRLEADAAARKQLKDIQVGKKPLAAFVTRWIEAARQLGKLESERAQLDATPAEGGGAKLLAARNGWIRAVNALLANAELAEVDEATDRLIFGTLRAAERNADRRGRGGDKSGETPPPAPVGTPTPS